MFKFLFDLDPRLFERYQTLERNVRAESDSFYDSYLALLEHLVRYICSELEISENERESCGNLLGKPALKAYMLSIGVEDNTYEKLKDYTRKINKHKHSNQNTATMEQVLNYLAVLHAFGGKYAQSREITVTPFDSRYYLELFGSYERDSKELKGEMKNVDSRLDSIEQMLGEMKSNKGSEPQVVIHKTTEDLRRELIDFVKKSEQHFHYYGKHEDFLSEKRVVRIMALITSVLLLISSLFTLIGADGFDLGIWLRFLWIILCLIIVINVSLVGFKAESWKFLSRTYDDVDIGADMIARKTLKKKWSYRWIPKIVVVCSIWDILIVITECTLPVLIILALVFEVAFIVCMFVTLTKCYDFFDSYMVLCFTGFNQRFEEVTVVYDELTQRWYTENEFAERFSAMYEK